MHVAKNRMTSLSHLIGMVFDMLGLGFRITILLPVFEVFFAIVLVSTHGGRVGCGKVRL